MAQLQKGTTYADGDLVTGVNLNAHVDAAILLPGSIHEQTEETVTAATDEVNIWDASATALRRVKLSNLPPAAGITATQLTQANAAGVHQYAAGVQTATVYAVTLSPARAGAYVAGEVLRFTADTANVGNVNVNVNGRGSVNLLERNGLELQAEDIGVGSMVVAVCDGTDFRVVSVSARSSVFNAHLAPIATARVKGRTTAGTGAVEDLTMAQLRTLLNTATTFTSVSNVALPGSGAAITPQAHGLGAVPKFVRAVLICTSTDLGYAVNDEVNINSVQKGNAGQDQAFIVAANATNLYVAQTNDANVNMIPLAGGSATGLDETKWAIKLYASL